MTFTWSYLDLFIIIISIGLNLRFEQINERLKNTDRVNETQQFWKEIRIHYFNMFDLVEFMDSHISKFVLVAIGRNMLSLCTNIYTSLS